MIDTSINIGLYITYALILVALAALLYFSITQFIGNVRKSKTALWGVVALIVIYGLSYLISSPTDVSEAFLEKTNTTLSASKMIGSGIMMIYILFAATFLTLIGTEVAKLFKK